MLSIIFRTKIYSHVTIATDPDNVSFVFAAVKHTILSGIVEAIAAICILLMLDVQMIMNPKSEIRRTVRKLANKAKAKLRRAKRGLSRRLSKSEVGPPEDEEFDDDDETASEDAQDESDGGASEDGASNNGDDEPGRGAGDDDDDDDDDGAQRLANAGATKAASAASAQLLAVVVLSI